MKVSYVEGVANHNGPESCGAAREGAVQALTAGLTGRGLSREINVPISTLGTTHATPLINPLVSRMMYELGQGRDRCR